MVALAIGTTAYLGWRRYGTSVRHRLALYRISGEMSAIDRSLGAASESKSNQTSETLAALSARVMSLLDAVADEGGHFKIFIARPQVVQAGQVADTTGKRWNVVVCGRRGLSTLAWPVGSVDPAGIVSSPAFEFESDLPVSQRVAMPAQQPIGNGIILPIEVLIDDRPQRIHLTIDWLGNPRVKVQGWDNSDLFQQKQLDELGRYGYRNIDLREVKARQFPYLDPVQSARFMPDGKLAAVTREGFQIFDPTQGASKTINYPPDASRFNSQSRLSRDGRYVLMAGASPGSSIVFDLEELREKPVALPQLDSNIVDSGNIQISLETSGTAHLMKFDRLFAVDLKSGEIRTEDLVAGSDGSMKLLAVGSNRPLMNVRTKGRSFSVVGNRAVVAREETVLVFSRQANGWTPGKRMENLKVDSLALSPDGHWLVLCDYNCVKFYDVDRDRYVFEAMRDSFDAGAGLTWSDDGKLAALAPRGQPVLVKLDDEKLAIRIVLSTQNTFGLFRGASCLSPDGTQLAVFDNVVGVLKIWRVSDLLESARTVAR